MDTTGLHRAVAALAGPVLVAGMTAGCGAEASEGRAAAVAASAAAVAERARVYTGDPWERRAVAEHQRVPRRVQLAMDRALTQRLVREHRELLAELRTGRR